MFVGDDMIVRICWKMSSVFAHENFASITAVSLRADSVTRLSRVASVGKDAGRAVMVA